MLSKVALLILLSAQSPATAAASQPTGPAAAEPEAAAPQAQQDCRTQLPTEPGEVVVCAVRPNGYRIDPDVLAAERIKKNPKGLRPPERHVDTSCATVGPMGCRGGATIDFLSTGIALARMADKVAKGASVGSLFVTNPTPNDYELYLQAKRQRELREEAAFEAAAVKASKAEAPAGK